MTHQRKTARYGNTKAANIKKLQSHFTELAERVKREFIRLAAWLSIVGG